jgi:hypothetical protein
MIRDFLLILLAVLPGIVAVIALYFDNREQDKRHRHELEYLQREHKELVERLLQAKERGAEIPPPPEPELPLIEPLSPAMQEIIADFESPEGRRRAEAAIREMKSQGLSDVLVARHFETPVTS